MFVKVPFTQTYVASASHVFVQTPAPPHEPHGPFGPLHAVLVVVFVVVLVDVVTGVRPATSSTQASHAASELGGRTTLGGRRLGGRG